MPPQNFTKRKTPSPVQKYVNIFDPNLIMKIGNEEKRMLEKNEITPKYLVPPWTSVESDYLFKFNITDVQ